MDNKKLHISIAGVFFVIAVVYVITTRGFPSSADIPTPTTIDPQESPTKSTGSLSSTIEPTAPSEHSLECVPASSQQVRVINDGIADVNPENYTVEAFSVRSNGNKGIWMVAAIIFGSHEVMKDGMGPGVWAIGTDPESPGPVYSIGPYANEFSSWVDAQTSDISIDLDDQGVQAALVCARENAKFITPIPPTPHHSDFTSPDFSTGDYSELSGAECLPENTQQQEAILASVISGDTIEVFIDGSLFEVSYIGISAPEMTSALGEFSRSENFKNVLGKELLLIKDASDPDETGKLFRYVIAEDLFINLYLLSEGYAVVSNTETELACATAFLEAEGSARSDGKGIWLSVTPTGVVPSPEQVEDPSPSVSIDITSIFNQGAAGENQPDEYVEIINNGTEVTQLQGWSLGNNTNNVYHFTAYKIAPGERCRIYTNEFHPETCGFSFYSAGSEIWSDSSDCAYLRDQAGDLIAEMCY